MTDSAPDQKPAAPGQRRPVAMTPYAIAVALFAAFVVGGILGKAVPLWRSLCSVSRSGPPFSSSWTATHACPGAGSTRLQAALADSGILAGRGGDLPGTDVRTLVPDRLAFRAGVLKACPSVMRSGSAQPGLEPVA